MNKHPRVVLLNKLFDLLRKVHGGRYFVRRGPIAYEGFPFDAQPYACAILVPEFKLRIPKNSEVTNVGTPITITVEMVTRLRVPDRKQIEAGTQPQMNDDLMQEFADDVDRVLHELCKARTEDDENSITLGLVPNSDNAVEMSDESMMIQGCFVTFKLVY